MNLFHGRVLLDANPCEPLRLEECLDYHAIDQREHANAETDQVLFKGEGDCAHCSTTILNQSGLHKQGANDDEEEETVVEEALEYVVLLVEEFAGVDFVEDLHENEGVEDDRVQSDLVDNGSVQVNLTTCLCVIETT